MINPNDKFTDWSIVDNNNDLSGIGFKRTTECENYEWTLELFKDKKTKDHINLRLIFQNLELNDNPDIVCFPLTPENARHLAITLIEQAHLIETKQEEEWFPMTKLPELKRHVICRNEPVYEGDLDTKFIAYTIDELGNTVWKNIPDLVTEFEWRYL